MILIFIFQAASDGTLIGHYCLKCFGTISLIRLPRDINGLISTKFPDLLIDSNRDPISIIDISETAVV